MKIKFLGYKTRKKSGCPACGSRIVTNHKIQRDKKITMPNGQVKMFWANEEYEVSKNDCDFLMSLNDDTGKNMFKVVL